MVCFIIFRSEHVLIFQFLGGKALEQNKKWCTRTLIAIITLLVVITGLVAIIDPLFHYRKPIAGISYILDNENYINPGIAKHFEYDSLITGSSMVQNFRTSYFEEVLEVNAIKVPYSGASLRNINIILDIALRNNPDLKTVYLGLDQHMLKRDFEETRDPLPYYLYDENLFNDVNYLLNKDVLFRHLAASILATILGKAPTSFDDFSSFQDQHTFSQYSTLSSESNITRISTPYASLEEVIELANDNLRYNILPLVERYPNVEFVILFPPYSIIYWYRNYTEHEIGILAHTIASLISYENVRLYFFQNIPSIITNLYNYKDYTHYSADINTYMVDCFKNGTHRLTPEDYETELIKMCDMAGDFDYGLIFGESNPFINERNYALYLNKLNDPRYITFIVARMDEPVPGRVIFSNQCNPSVFDNTSDACGYTAIVNGSDVIFQKSSDEALIFSGEIDGMEVVMKSEKIGGYNYIEVTIDGVRYTTNQAGVNLVVYDKEHLRVMDNIAVNVKDGSISRR